MGEAAGATATEALAAAFSEARRPFFHLNTVFFFPSLLFRSVRMNSDGSSSQEAAVETGNAHNGGEPPLISEAAPPAAP